MTGTEVGEHSLEVRGLRVHLQRKGRGAPLLVLHAEDGGGQWRPFHDALAEHFSVLLPDHPGFGLSDQPTWLDGMQDLVYYYLELLESLGLERVRVVGESFGGWLAAALAVGHPERIERLVLVGPLGLKQTGRAIPDLFAMSHEQWVRATLYDEALAAQQASERPGRDVVERQLRDKATLARLAWSPHLHDPRLTRWLHRARMPALLVWGQHDQILPVETAELWLEHLSEARLVVIEVAGHYPQVEQPVETAKVVREFLAT